MLEIQLAAWYSALAQRVEALEDGLDLACQALGKLVAEIEPTAAGPVAAKLRAFDSASIDVAAVAAAKEVDELVQADRKPAAAKLYRELANVIWDDAHRAIDAWGLAPGAAKNGLARLIAARRRRDFLRDLAKTAP